MADETQVPGSVEFPVPLLTPSQLRALGGSRDRWLWQGYLGARLMTAFISSGKSGKTTLASILLAMLKNGGQIGGLAVAAGKAVVVTEESRETWDERCKRLGIAEESARFLCRPFRGARPTLAQWQAFVARLTALHRETCFDLLMIDPLASFLPGGAENYAPAMLDFLLPLQALAEAGPAVWTLHHPGKTAQADGHAGRGSSALLGFVDILIEMSCYKALRSPDRRRRLRAYSRKDETPRNLLIELNPEGTGYTVPTREAADLMESWPEVHEILQEAVTKLSGKEILEQWPDGSKPPTRSTLWRWLKRAADQGRLACQSTERPGDPFRYWLPERMEMMRPDPSAGPEALEAWNTRRIQEIFAGIDRYQRDQGIQPAQASPATPSATPPDFGKPITPTPGAAKVPAEGPAEIPTSPARPDNPPSEGPGAHLEEKGPPRVPTVASADSAPSAETTAEDRQPSQHDAMLRFLANLGRPS
jgi:hypothetical protein